jgi:hypothetical protein
MPPQRKPLKQSQNDTKSRKKASNAGRTPRRASKGQLSKADFKKLQKKWYKKLAKSGFLDIESGREHGNINGQSLKDQRFHERLALNSGPTQHFYSRWSCYLAHHSKGELTKLEQAAIRMYSEGVAIGDMLKDKAMKGINYYTLFYLIERLQAHIDLWNRTDPNGMDFVADVQAGQKMKGRE